MNNPIMMADRIVLDLMTLVVTILLVSVIGGIIWLRYNWQHIAPFFDHRWRIGGEYREKGLSDAFNMPGLSFIGVGKAVLQYGKDYRLEIGRL